MGFNGSRLKSVYEEKCGLPDVKNRETIAVLVMMLIDRGRRCCMFLFLVRADRTGPSIES